MQHSNIQSIEQPNELLIPEIIRLLNEGHTVTLKARGYSMRPFVEHERDSVLLEKIGKVNIGDVVLAEVSPGRYVLHRLIQLNSDMAVLRGDGNLSNEYCSVHNIQAKALGFYRRGQEKLDSTSGRKWKTYSFVWTRLYPIRRYLLFAYRVMRKLKLIW